MRVLMEFREEQILGFMSISIESQPTLVFRMNNASRLDARSMKPLAQFLNGLL